MKNLTKITQLFLILMIPSVTLLAGNPTPPTSISGPRSVCTRIDFNDVKTYTLVQNSGYCHGKTYISVSNGVSSKSVLNFNNESFTVRWNENNGANDLTGTITFTSEFDDDNCPEVPTLIGTNSINVRIRPKPIVRNEDIVFFPGSTDPLKKFYGVEPIDEAISYSWSFVGGIGSGASVSSINNSVSQINSNIVPIPFNANGRLRLIVTTSCGSSDFAVKDFSFDIFYGISEQDNLLVYPNPVGKGDKLNLLFSENDNVKIIRIIDKDGNEVKNINFSENNIDTRSLNKGKFTIIYTTNSKQKVKHFIKN